MDSEGPNPWSRLEWLKATGPLPQPTSRGEAALAPRSIMLPYRGGFGRLISGIVFFGIAAWCFASWAQSGRGLMVEGITLGPRGARIFFLSFAVASTLMALLAAYWILWQVTGARRIELSDDAMILPRWGLARRAHTLARTDITSFTVRRYKNYTYLTLWRGRRLFTINSYWLPAHGDIETIIEWLYRATRRCE
jgi:hypothetical protein